MNDSKTKRIINEINNSNVPEDEKRFLTEAAKRHTVFNYESIADYYAHATPEMQLLMERSALVIIDFEKAIQLGYVKLCDEIIASAEAKSLAKLCTIKIRDLIFTSLEGGNNA